MRSMMLIMSGLIFFISSLQHFFSLFLDVVYLVSKLQCFFNFSSVRDSVVQLCWWTDQFDGSSRLKSITYIEWTLSRRVVLSMIVTVLNVWETFIPCSTMLVVIHAEKLYNQAIHNFCPSIRLRAEHHRQINICVDFLLEGYPKNIDKFGISIRNNSCR